MSSILSASWWFGPSSFFGKLFGIKSPAPPKPQTYTVFLHTMSQTKPVTNIAVQVSGPTSLSVTTDGAGNTTLTALTAGSYTAKVAAPGWQNTTTTWTVPASTDVTVSLTPALPAPPTRTEILTGNISFQGLTISNLTQFGSIPAWGPEISGMNAADRAIDMDAHLANGDTVKEVTLSWNYDDGPYDYPVPGKDYANDLPGLAALIFEILTHVDAQGRRFKGIWLFLGADGLQSTQNPDGTWAYNDPGGWTRGFGWLMANFQSIYNALKNYNGVDLTPYICFIPGYDGVVPAWGGDQGTPNFDTSRVGQWLTLARGIVGPQGYLGLELSAGYWAWTGEANDYATPAGQNLDLVLYEFPYPPVPGNDQDWQISKRLLGPDYVRPADEPPTDDPGTSPYGKHTTPRGDLICYGFEYDTYGWVRGQRSKALVTSDAAYIRSMGWKYVA